MQEKYLFRPSELVENDKKSKFCRFLVKKFDSLSKNQVLISMFFGSFFGKNKAFTLHKATL